MRLSVEIAPGTELARAQTSGGLGGDMFALSPDGSRMALSLRGADGQVRLHTRLLDQSRVTPMAGTENGFCPFFSPAGDWIGFFADGKLKKISVEGGAPITLCDAPLPVGGSWGDDGNIIAALNRSGGLSRGACRRRDAYPGDEVEPRRGDPPLAPGSARQPNNPFYLSRPDRH